mmetsp:Transcript_16098/g.48725  ORF Transcript_16098/g.48725 Transcript_16098/m.48725 type:complete len:217 (-) Transcript_16098:78-728(-)
MGQLVKIRSVVIVLRDVCKESIAPQILERRWAWNVRIEAFVGDVNTPGDDFHTRDTEVISDVQWRCCWKALGERGELGKGTQLGAENTALKLLEGLCESWQESIERDSNMERRRGGIYLSRHWRIEESKNEDTRITRRKEWDFPPCDNMAWQRGVTCGVAVDYFCHNRRIVCRHAESEQANHCANVVSLTNNFLPLHIDVRLWLDHKIPIRSLHVG